MFRVFPEALDPCFAFCTLSRSSLCNAYHHFKLQHVQGKTFVADGLSRRDAQPCDEIFPNSEENLDEPSGILEILLDKNGGDPPLDFEEFKDQIDTCGGYVQTLALSICDFHDTSVTHR